MMKYKNEDQEWQKVYEFWKNVPTILEIEHDTFHKIVDQNFRGSILDILREGIKDDSIQENGLSRRYAMSAPEMLPKIREKLGYDVKLSNIYFHLEKLEKANLIQEVTKRLEGKHHVTYYGRTSKLILCCRSDDADKCESKFLTSAYSLAEHLNLDIDTQMLNTIIEKIHGRNDELYQLEKEWIQNNHETLFQLDIDVLELFDFIKGYLRYSDPIIQELISQFHMEIKLEIYRI
jgi:hypothetical protein